MNQSDFRSDQFNLKNVFATMLRGVLGLGAISFMIVTLIGLYGAVDAGYDAVNHFRILFILPAILLALLALIARARAAAIVTLTALLVHAFAIVPEVYARWAERQAEPASHRLKIVTFNMRFHFADPARLRQFVKEEKPDIVVMQEAWGRSATAIDGLRDLLPFRRDCIDTRLCNLAVLSRHRIETAEILPATSPGAEPARPRMASARIDISTITGRRGEMVTVTTTHLSWPLPHERQLSQFEQIAGMVSGPDNRSVILAGDFNSTPWSHVMRRFEDTVPLQRVTRAVHSWPAQRRLAGFILPIPLLPIDHVFVGSKFRAVSVRRGPYLGSDHYPVIAEFAVLE